MGICDRSFAAVRKIKDHPCGKEVKKEMEEVDEKIEF